MGRKRLLIVTNHFFPEQFKVNDVAFDLADEGMEVTVLTGIPNYPIGKFFEGYSLFKRRNEVVKNVKIIRLPLIPRGNGTALRLIFNYLSFAFTSFIYSFYLALTRKFDLILVHHTSPIFIGLPALIVKKIQKIDLFFWNLDLWPESVMATTNIHNIIINRVLLGIVKIIYRHSNLIFISSKSFEQSIIDKGIERSKIVYLPNWAEDIFSNEVNQLDDVSAYIEGIKGFKLMFAGNIGEAQDFESLINAACKLRDYQIHWLIVGGGRKLAWLIENIKKNDLNGKFHLLGRHSIELMPPFFAKADAMVVSLKDEYIFSLTVPAKIQSYMAYGKPVLAMINGEGNSLVEEAKCGLVCSAGDYESLSQNIIKLASVSERELRALGENGRRFYHANFDKKLIMNRLKTKMNLDI